MSISSVDSNPTNSHNTQHFKRRIMLPLHFNHLWKIERGIVRTMTYLEDGTVVTLGLWGSGDIVGRALSQVEPYQVESLTQVEAINLHPNAVVTVPELLLTHIHQAEELMVIRSYKTVDAMIIKLLIWLSNKFGCEVDQGRLIAVRLTHQDIAELIGSTRVSVTRVLKLLEEQHLIQRLPLSQILLSEAEIWHYEI